MGFWGTLVDGTFGKLLEGADDIIENFTGDEAQREKMRAQLKQLIVQKRDEMKKEGADIVKAEAESEYWLTANWRPLTMLVFVFIIANNYILHPYLSLFFESAPKLDIPKDMWSLLKIGLGGYVVGRSGEKGIRELGKFLGKKES